MTSAFLDVRSAAAPSAVSLKGTTDLVRLFALDHLPVDRSRLVCRWHHGADGRLSCSWEPDIVPEIGATDPSQTKVEQTEETHVHHR
jgi:hypothetical protein